MKIREATESDRFVWDAFVDANDGMFHQYFSWKYCFEKSRTPFFLLMIEDDQSQLTGIFSLIKRRYHGYSVLVAKGYKGVLLRRDLPEDNKNEAIAALVKYIDQKYSSGCSTFLIVEQLPIGYTTGQNTALLNSGFRIINDKDSGLPCSHILPLQAPFEEHIWKTRWSSKFRQTLNKVEKSGIKVIDDHEFKYTEEFIKLVRGNYKRHGSRLPKQDYLRECFKVFEDRIRLFAALDHDRPIALLACFYTPTTCYLWEIGTPAKEVNDINKYCCRVAIEHACNSGYAYVDFLGAYTEGLSNQKKRFGTVQTPVLEYEKTYSAFRLYIQKGHYLVRQVFHNPGEIRKIFSAVWKKVSRR
jgi:hypothetical protein